jgi:hypothetical protein
MERDVEERGRERRRTVVPDGDSPSAARYRPLQESGETALHFSVRTADHTSLHLVDFLVQNRYGGDIVRHHRAPQNLLISSNRL